MTHAVMLVFVYVFLVVEIALRGVWDFSLAGVDDIRPSLTLILLTFIATWGNGRFVIWWALGLGLLLDLQVVPMATAGGPDVHAAILGPEALGYAAAAYLIIQMRSIFLRDSLFTSELLLLSGGVLAGIVTVGLWSIRALGITPGEGMVGWQASDELLRRFFVIVYTMGMMLPLHFALNWTKPFWQFHEKKKRLMVG